MYDYMGMKEQKEAFVTLNAYRSNSLVGQTVKVFANAHWEPVEVIGECTQQHRDGLSVNVDFRQTKEGYYGRGRIQKWWHRRIGKFQKPDMRTYFYAWENILIPGIRS